VSQKTLLGIVNDQGKAEYLLSCGLTAWQLYQRVSIKKHIPPIDELLKDFDSLFLKQGSEKQRLHRVVHHLLCSKSS